LLHKQQAIILIASAAVNDHKILTNEAQIILIPGQKLELKHVPLLRDLLLVLNL
jgi:hypothetical protein